MQRLPHGQPRGPRIGANRLLQAAALAAALLWGAPAMAAKPNILFVVVDDLRPALGAYGDSRAVTPHMDALAAGGFTFTRAFASVPVCGASRASLLSGLQPGVQRFISYDSRLDVDAADHPSLPALLQQAGYITQANGKVFDVSADSAGAWSIPLWNPANRWHSPVDPGQRHSHLQKAYRAPLTEKLGPVYEHLPGADDSYPDGEVARKTVADLQRLAQQDQPFFLAVGFRKPHLPFNAPQKYWQMHSRTRFNAPGDQQSHVSLVPQGLHGSPELRLQYAGVAKGPIAAGTAGDYRRAYYAAVSYIDALLGQVLAGLQASGLAQNTIVMLLGDHGFHLGEHGLWTKHNLDDVSLQVPLIVRLPGRAASQTQALVSLVDIYSTVADLAGVEVSEQVAGTSLLPLISGEKPHIHQAVYSRWLDGDSLRTERYRYVGWRDASGQLTAEMLFDLQADPTESVNVATDPQYAKPVAALRKRLFSEFAPQAPSAMLVEFARRFRSL